MDILLKTKSFLSNDLISKILDSFFGKASQLIFTMVFSFVCARLYGAEVFGQYTYGFTLVSLLMFLAKAGMDNGLIYYIPKDGYKYVSFSFVAVTLLAILIITIASFIVDEHYVRLMMPLVLFLSLEQMFFSVYRANGNIKKYYFINGFLSISIRIVLIVIFYLTFEGHQNVNSVIISLYVSFVIVTIVYFRNSRNTFSKVTYSKEFLLYSLPLFVSSVMGVVLDRIDIIMLGNMVSKREVGIFQISVQIANITSILLFIMNTVLAPKISELYHSGKLEDLKNIYIKSTRMLGIISLFATIVLCLLRKYLLLIFGYEMINGQTALVLRAIGQFINAAVGSVWLVLSMTGKPKIQMYANLFACIFNITLNMILIPIYGIDGAAFASMISIGVVSVFGYVVVNRHFQVKPYKFF
ncbi:flippase [Priestia megaterium]|uniref:flippase n=1 Tax=Priestia megaterium TaxID=1404 RepID=UPI002042086E|nr:flippase [Priestia megaterium]MCM3792154.1 flippase [Priestia megaterium]